MDDAEDDASLATRPRSPAAVVMSDRPENGHAPCATADGPAGSATASAASTSWRPRCSGPRRALRPLVDGRHRLRAPERLPAVRGPHDREILSRVARAPLQFPARLWRGASHEARLFVARLLCAPSKR